MLGAAALLGLAACETVPQPFRGNPGRLARQLARPPSYRVAIPAPANAMLPQAEAEELSRLLADALGLNDVPAVAGESLPLDWQLVVATERDGASIIPRYALRDADGGVLGTLSGRPVPAADWARGGEPLLRRVASEAGPRLADMLGRIDAQRRTGDERASGRGPPVILVRRVAGAPGDGNDSLTLQMRRALAELGFQVQEEAEGAGFAVTGAVNLAPTGRGLQRIEIVWTVSRRDGYDLGRVLQLNEIPQGSLDGLWGDVAMVVAQEASGGVRDVVANAGGMPDRPAQAAAPAGTPVPAEAPAATPAAAPAPAAPPRPAPPSRRAR